MFKKKKIGLVLGGGGARGLAHVGVIKELERAGIVADVIVGASMGAVIGGVYALCFEASTLEERVLGLIEDKNLSKLESLAAKSNEEEKEIIFQRLATFVSNLVLWNLRAINGFIVEGDRFKEIIDRLVEGRSFSETKVKFGCTALDINWGEEVLFTEGLLSEAIFSSIAIPGVFPPVEKNGKVLVDGGIINLVPVTAAQKLGAEIIIAVDVSLNIKPTQFNNGHDILFRTEMIKEKEIGQLKMQDADIVIRPEVGDYSWARFSEVASLVKEGQRAVKNNLVDIKAKIKKENCLSNKIFSRINKKSK